MSNLGLIADIILRLRYQTSLLFSVVAAGLFSLQGQTPQVESCPTARPVPPELTLPAKLPAGEPLAFEAQVLKYLSSYAYRNLGWCVDKSVRDTGPFLGGISYGTHTAVRIYYSPQVMKWLRAGRPEKAADGRPYDMEGAVIIKEQYGSAAPAERYRGWPDSQLQPTDWTFMIRRAAASKDGWFWGEVWSTPAMPTSPTQYPNAGFDLYCLRCHASAEKAYTFSSLKNIVGFSGDPITFNVDNSWRQTILNQFQNALLPKPMPVPVGLDEHSHNRLLSLVHEDKAKPLEAEDLHGELVLHFTPPHRPEEVQSFPPEPLDHYGTTAKGVPQFLTSDNCLGCHSAAAAPPAGPSMWIPQGPGVNVSPYGEWRWSPMGLAGRDPVFFAQLESELAYVAKLPDRKLPQMVIDTCMQCHGAMGKRTFAAENPGKNFDLSFIQDRNLDQAGFRYGGLARDGISCTICHHIADDRKPINEFLATQINGKFDVTKPDELFGPFGDKEISPDTMDAALGAKPKHAAFTESSRLCASCHVINLPVVDGMPGQHSVEQNTYIEWLNSQYQNEYGGPNPKAKSCQDCHMRGSYKNDALNISVPRIQSRIALIEDQTYPLAEHILPLDKIDVRFREEGYRRHELLGLNGFLLEMFGQFSDILGVRTSDYMSGAMNDLQSAIGNIVQQAQHETADLSVAARFANGVLTADVAVTNKAGHKFPSGVGFRRAFLDFEVIDDKGRVLFASGQTDQNGVLLGADGKPLPTEFFDTGTNGQQYQPHFDQTSPITSASQVQIYEELVKDAEGQFTTSFIRRDKIVKDNRLLPIGWTTRGPDPTLNPRYLEETHATGTHGDPNYENGEGTSKVRYRVTLPAGVDASKLRVEVTLFHQSIPPYYLRDRFQGASGPATKRLEYFIGRLNLGGTPLENWKLRIAQTQALVPH